MSRTVLVTGGTGALGTEVTRRFLLDGHQVAVTWRRQGERDALVGALGPLGERLLPIAADVTDEAAVTRVFQEVAAGLGPVGVLVHLVGGWRGGERVQSYALETWERMLSVNLRSAFLCCRAALPGMLTANWGRIVLVSARAAHQPRAGQVGYAVAKAGVAVLAQAIAEETRGTGVTANIIAPSTLDTPANRAALPDADHSGWVPPALVADTVAFLASEAAGQLRGAWLPAYGSA